MTDKVTITRAALQRRARELVEGGEVHFGLWLAEIAGTQGYEACPVRLPAALAAELGLTE